MTLRFSHVEARSAREQKPGYDGTVRTISAFDLLCCTSACDLGNWELSVPRMQAPQPVPEQCKWRDPLAGGFPRIVRTCWLVWPQGKGEWKGDRPAVWRGYFQKLAAQPSPGVFVDVGAGDGRFMSNTAFLEGHLCWRGVAVEPTDNEYPKLEKNRPRATTVCARHGAVPLLVVVTLPSTLHTCMSHAHPSLEAVRN